MSDESTATEKQAPPTRLPADAFTFDSDTREVMNPITKAKETISYRFPRITTDEQMDALCGGRTRAREIIEQKNKSRISSFFSDARTKGIDSVEAWQKHLANAISSLESVEEPLEATRGTGNTAKAKSFDTLQSELANVNTNDPAALLAALKAAGFSIPGQA